MMTREEWLDNQSIGPKGVKAIAVISALLGSLGTIGGLWLVMHGQFEVGFWLVGFSGLFGFGIAYGFGSEINSMKYLVL